VKSGRLFPTLQQKPAPRSPDDASLRSDEGGGDAGVRIDASCGLREKNWFDQG